MVLEYLQFFEYGFLGMNCLKIGNSSGFRAVQTKPKTLCVRLNTNHRQNKKEQSCQNMKQP